MHRLPVIASVAAGALLLLALALAAPDAGAEWRRAWSMPANTYFLDVQSPNGVDVYAAGVRFDNPQRIPDIYIQIFASSDGGETFTNISGNLDDTKGNLFDPPVPAAVYFDAAGRGWVAASKSIHYTTDGGGSWSTTTVPTTMKAIHFFDSQRGVAVGTGGTILTSKNGGAGWAAATSPTETELLYQFWADSQHGWAAGHDTREESDPFGEGPDQTFEENGVVIRTTDGGTTWNVVWTLDGRLLGPIFFLPDGETGWLAAARRLDAGGKDMEAELYVTTDGGESFEKAALPLAVGTFGGALGGPVDTSRIAAMYWQDADHGHLGGSAFLMEASSSSSSGGVQPSGDIWRTVDYRTDDGGTSWEHTELGDLPFSLSPDNDGAIVRGYLHDMNRGCMIGVTSMWVYEQGCTTPADCGAGNDCVDGTCEAIGVPDDGTPDSGAGEQGHPPDGAEVWPDGASGGDSSTWTGYGSGSGGGSGCSCDLGQRKGTPLELLLLAGWSLLVLLGRRRLHAR